MNWKPIDYAAFARIGCSHASHKFINKLVSYAGSYRFLTGLLPLFEIVAHLRHQYIYFACFDCQAHFFVLISSLMDYVKLERRTSWSTTFHRSKASTRVSGDTLTMKKWRNPKAILPNGILCLTPGWEPYAALFFRSQQRRMPNARLLNRCYPP